jgi:hypothetical protein
MEQILPVRRPVELNRRLSPPCHVRVPGQQQLARFRQIAELYERRRVQIVGGMAQVFVGLARTRRRGASSDDENPPTETYEGFNTRSLQYSCQPSYRTRRRKLS